MITRALLPSPALLALLLTASSGTHGQGTASRPAVPIDARAAILDAFRLHRIVALGDAHGNRQGAAFEAALVADPRLPAVVNDILIESGNSRYQDLVDRYGRGEEVPIDRLQRVWLDTTQQQTASLEPSALLASVRRLNGSLPPARQVRVLLGEPPIDCEQIRTREDMRKWDASPLANRDQFAVDCLAKRSWPGTGVLLRSTAPVRCRA